VHRDSHARERDARGGRLAEEVVRDAPGDREIEQLSAVEPEPAAAGLRGPVDHERVRAGAPYSGRGSGERPDLDLEHLLLPVADLVR
jgi:hypothetical protein